MGSRLPRTTPNNQIRLFKIYDRYGKFLKELNSNSLGWDGTYKGNTLPSGDYWYLATVKQNGKSFEVKGHFALRR